LSVIFTVAVWLQPAAVYWCVCEKSWLVVPVAGYVCVAPASAVPSQLHVAVHGLSTLPGSVNVPLKVAGENARGPLNDVVPLKAVMAGATFETVTLNVAWPEPPSL